jgi:hypothetical protein
MNTEFPCKVLQIESDEHSFNYKYQPNYREDLFNDIDICSINYDVPELMKKFSFDIDPKLHETFIKDPFDDHKYIKMENFQDYIIKEKFDATSDIARLLGAKSCKFSIEVLSAKKINWEVEAGGKYKFVDISLDVKKEKQESYNKQYKIEKSYSNGHRPSLNDYEKANQKAKQFGLIHDLDVKSLINERNPNDSNIIMSRFVKESLTRETNSSLDIALNLSILDKFNLGSDYNRVAYERYECIGCLEFTFGD